MRYLRLVFLCLCILPLIALARQPPPLELVDVYPGGLDLADYWVSEKYDGVRGYWDGKRFLTRQGTPIDVPDWFIENFPETALDGELWVGYGKFSQASSIVRLADKKDDRWQAIQYLIFDLPDSRERFDQRVGEIERQVKRINASHVRAIKQFRVADEQQLQIALHKVVSKGGEGLVLHRGSQLYAPGRGVGMYKLKPYQDAEARVLGYIPGKGRLKGLMGAIRVETQDGRRFRIGGGFTDKERAHPPAIGSWVTYRHNGKTVNGLPRFARFLHERPEGPPPE